MHDRFVQYLRKKKLTQKKICELSLVAQATVSRFCSGSPISSDRLLRLLQICDDLSLEWLFFGTGTMIRSRENNMTVNFGQYAGSDVVMDDGVMVKDSHGVRVNRPVNKDYLALIAEKDRIIAQKDGVIAEKDTVISERDETIRELYRMFKAQDK